MQTLRLFFVSIAALALIAGCTPQVSQQSYTAGSVGQANRTVRGTIISIRQVNIEGSKSGVGTASGAVVGGVAGSSLGGTGRDAAVGAVLGAVVGGIAGKSIEEGTSQQTGWEYVIQLKDDTLVTVVQGGPNELARGQRVLVIYGARARVIADPQQ